MIETIVLLRVSCQQQTCLLTHLAAYRSSLWQTVLPSPERNQLIRRLQDLYMRLTHTREPEQAEVVLSLTREEASLVRHLCAWAMQQYGAAPTSTQRNQALGELAALRVLVERALLQAQIL
ncbi:MAG: hypothetical protein ACRDHW_18935 [Ktedonobacteraceae bacterium]